MPREGYLGILRSRDRLESSLHASCGACDGAYGDDHLTVYLEDARCNDL